jgi:Asp-tRNA(Asn)/Glu-tRNA(Gln) amidotransferase A subunit family amidase
MAFSGENSGSIRALRARYRTGLADPMAELKAASARSNSNAGKNVYLGRDEDWSRREVERLSKDGFEGQPLWGVPVAIKDCFDVEGFMTTCGSQALAGKHGVASEDSDVAKRLRRSGAVIVGKTHLHQLAYGITGENPDYGDCVQPEDARLLTGGSSSGSAASVQEGSAMAAIGTDTGGSIRVPAMLCGLTGYRGSLTLGARLWGGGYHLAPAFDTIGWLYRDLGDGPLLGEALFGLERVAAPAIAGLRVGIPEEAFFHDCEDEVLTGLEGWMAVLRENGAKIERFDAGVWAEAMDIFVPLQASEAAELIPEPRDVFDKAIAERLRWGAERGAVEIAALRGRHAGFREENERRFAEFDVLLMPCSPVAELRAREDHAATRARLLRYTAPVSLLGRPAVTLPRRRGGPQLVGRLGEDAKLLALTAELGRVMRG